MDDATTRRIGGNESSFRRVNETLRAGKTLADASKRFPFRCECGVLGCNRLVELTLPEYEAVRSNPKRFFLIDGHEITETEHVVERRERYTVVEKEDAGAEVAIDTDPRA
ncbi:MAG: hypothetical protein JWO90_80 [Solirubrobacterales bacterium]|jgi:hypothetical protein|nr:hypothetical protein [Solirubrobacterales bacterium]